MFSVRTLGGVSVELDGAVQDAFGTQRKTLALLTLLAVSRGKGISRDRVATYLWPQSDMERSRGALKQALHVVRRLLPQEAILGTSELRLNPQQIRSDVDEFLCALEEGDLQRAVDRYGGPFLDGFYLRGSVDFEQWAATQRDDLARRYMAALEQLARAAVAGGDHAEAVGFWRRIQAEDPLNSRITVELMAALEAAGERSAALRCAGDHERLLRIELDSDPDPAILEQAARLREQTPAATVSRSLGSPVETARPTDASPVVPDGREGSSPDMLAPERPRPALMYPKVIVLLVVGLVLWSGGRYYTQRPPAAVGGTTDRSIAVLPFVNTNGDPRDEHFSDGLTDELIGALGKVAGLRVAARTSTFALKGRGLSIPAVADALGVATVVEGAVRREGDRLKVTAQLVNMSNGGVLWADAYDRELTDVFAVQEEIAYAIAAALSAELPLEEGRQLVRRPTADLEAYDLYLQGRHGWSLPSRERLERAAILYRRAVERDPTFAMAYAGLAETYVNLSNFAFLPTTQALARAKVAAERALELDPTLSEAHVAHGFVLTSELDFEGAEAAFQRAIELNPNYPWGHHYYSLLLAMLGRMDAAVIHNRQALALDPLSLPANAHRGILANQVEDRAGAERELRRALALAPDYVLTLQALGSLKAASGEFDEALPLLEAAAANAPAFTGVPGALAFVYHMTGRRAEADSILAAVDAAASVAGGRMRANQAFAHAAFGRLDAAFSLLEQLDWDVPTLILLQADPLLSDLRSDSRYARLLRNSGVADPR